MPSSTSIFSRTARSTGRLTLGAILAVLALELLFRALPVSTATETGYYFDPMIQSYRANGSFMVATGWSLENARRNVANNFGFLADHDFTADTNAIALIGDSFVEANMLPSADRLAAQLERQLPGRKVYALGTPGSSLLDYAERIRFARAEFAIRDFVLLLERGDVMQSLCGSGNVVASCLDPQTFASRVERRAPPGTLKRILRRMALAQYLYSQLKLDPAGWLQGLIAGSGTEASRRELNANGPPPDAAARIIREFFARTRPQVTGRMLIVLLPGVEPSIQAELTQQAMAANVAIVDTEAALAQLGAKTGLSNFVSPRDKHLNRLALRAVASQIGTVLDSNPPGASQL